MLLLVSYNAAFEAHVKVRMPNQAHPFVRNNSTHFDAAAGKWKASHSQSVDVGCAAHNPDSAFSSSLGGVGSSDPCVCEVSEEELPTAAQKHQHHGKRDKDKDKDKEAAPPLKKQWTEHVWSEYP